MKKGNDDEYVRFILSASHRSNKDGQELAISKGLRSLERNKRLINEVFTNPSILKFPDGSETSTFNVNFDRWDNFFNCLASALYYNDYKESFYSDWEIINYDLFISPRLLRGKPDPYNSVRATVDKVRFIEKTVQNPDIFRYAFGGYRKNNFIYRMIFFGGFRVFALPKKGWRDVV